MSDIKELALTAVKYLYEASTLAELPLAQHKQLEKAKEDLLQFVSAVTLESNEQPTQVQP